MTGVEKFLFGLAALGCATAAIASETITYTYDARGRLVKAEINGSANNGIAINYANDKADNRTLRNVTGAPK